MADKFQRAFDLVLFGKDTPCPSNKTEDAGNNNLERHSGTSDVDTPPAVSPASPASFDEKLDVKVSTDSILSNGRAGLQRIPSSKTVSSRIDPQHSDSFACWNPTAFHIRPLSGLISIAVVVACVFCSLIVLLVSENEPVEDWPISPTVYLAIVAAIGNSALALARAQALPISWWYHASRGASIRALESHWHTTNTFGGALYYGKLSLLTAACIATSLSIINGPLLQKASSVRLGTTSSNDTLHLQLLPEVPWSFSGAYKSHEIFFQPDTWSTLRNWAEGNRIHFDVPECKGSCKATVHAPGVVKRNCTTQTWPITPSMTRNISATWGTWTSVVHGEDDPGTYTRSNPGFYVNLINGQVPGYPPAANREGAYLTVGLARWQDWDGSYEETSCWLYSAVVEYDVVIEDNTIDLDDTPNHGRFVRLANNTYPANITDVNHYELTTLDGITEWLSMFVNTNASLSLNSNGGNESTYSQDWATFNSFAAAHMDLYVTKTSTMAFKDPTDDVILKYDQIMFRGGVEYSNQLNDLPWNQYFDKDLSPNQTIVAKQSLTQNVFKSDLRWYAGAVAIELITILLVLPLFWGWWTLGGTNYTMSPFTMALAFDSPLLEDVNSAAGARGVVRKLGNMQVKFGLVGEHDAAGTHSTVVVSGRLGIAEQAIAMRPRKGVRFTR